MAACYHPVYERDDMSAPPSLSLVAHEYLWAQYPTSSVRDEPMLLRTNTRHNLPQGPDTSSAAQHDLLLDPQYAKYIQPSRAEISPGILEDGILLARHPYVAAFIAKLPPTTAQQKQAMRRPQSSSSVTAVDIFHVHDVLGIILGHNVSESLFALAALFVLPQFFHPAHFTLWGKDSLGITARRVQKVLDRKPKAIISPTAWYGIDYELTRIRSAHEKLFTLLPKLIPTAHRSAGRVETQVTASAVPASLKRRRGPALTRRKGARHGPARAARNEVEGEVEESEPPAKRARLDERAAAEALIELSKTAGPSKEPAADGEISRAVSRSSDRTLVGSKPEKPSAMPTRRSARLASGSVSPAEASPHPVPEVKGDEDDSSDAESSSTRVEVEEVVVVKVSTQDEDAAPRRSPRARKPTTAKTPREVALRNSTSKEEGQEADQTPAPMAVSTRRPARSTKAKGSARRSRR